MSQLHGKIAVVAGATRGAGRAIALALGAAGAMVYATGRSTRGNPSDIARAETIDETAEIIQARGGRATAVRVDHTDGDAVRGLFERVNHEHGRLDILINDIWGGEALFDMSQSFWEHSLSKGLMMIERGIFTHIITSYYAAPLLIASGGGLIIEVTDGDNADYRGNLYYDFVKTGVIRLALAQSHELKDKGVTALALTPGFLRSEQMLDYFGVTEANWRDAVAKEPYFAESETPYFIGQAVVALAADPNVAAKTGQALATWNLAEEYGFDDYDGRRPHWRHFFEAMQAERQD
ncbi:MAG: SDR family oxidoreductase [Chloroflexota bacterium]|nr:SDR family oxidoreductase [Chloroflexota bacterium]